MDLKMIRCSALQTIITNIAMNIRAYSPDIRGADIEDMVDGAHFEFLRSLVRVHTDRANINLPSYSFVYSSVDGKLHTAQRFNNESNQWDIVFHYSPHSPTR